MKYPKTHLSIALALALVTTMFVGPQGALAAEGDYTPQYRGGQTTYPMPGEPSVTFYDVYGNSQRNLTTAAQFFEQVAKAPSPGSGLPPWQAWQGIGVYAAGARLLGPGTSWDLLTQDIQALQDGNNNSNVGGTNDRFGRWNAQGPFMARSLYDLQEDIVAEVAKKEESNRTTWDPGTPPGPSGFAEDHIAAAVKDGESSGPIIWSMQYKRNSRAGNPDDFAGVVTVMHGFKLQYVNLDPLNSAAGEETDAEKLKTMPGVSYTAEETNSFLGGAKNESGVTANVSQTISQSHDESVSNSRSDMRQYSFSEMIGAETSFETGIPFLAKGQIKVQAQITAQQAWGFTTTNTNTVSDSDSKDTNVSVPLPPYTQVVLKQNLSKAQMSISYDYPVAVSYQVSVFVFGAQRGLTNGRIAQMARFGGYTGVNASAYENLYHRFGNQGSYESTYGDRIDYSFSRLSSNTGSVRCSNGNRTVGSNFYNLLGLPDTVPMHYVSLPADDFYHYRPLSVTGGVLEYTGTGASTQIFEYQPIYPLDRVRTVDPNLDSIELVTDEVKRVDSIALAGQNVFEGDYYGFRQSQGHWVLVDSAGELLPASSDIATLTTDPVSQQAVLKGGTKEGTVYLKYLIDEHSYSYFENPLTETFQGAVVPRCTKNADLSRTAVIPVNVKRPYVPPVTVSGRILDADTGQGLWATVTLKNATTSEVVDTTYADSSGSFSFSGVESGNYVITATLFSYESATSVPFNVYGTNTSRNLILSKTTYAAEVSPERIAYPSIIEGFAPLSETVVTITNTGTGSLTGLTASLHGSDFEISTGLSGTTVARGDSVTVRVRPKTGLVAGQYADTLSIMGDRGISLVVTLSFDVTSTAKVTISPTAFTYAPREEGYVQADLQKFTITNLGTETVSGLSALLSGTDFGLVGNLGGVTLAPGEQTWVSAYPKAGLAPGVHSDGLSITAGTGSDFRILKTADLTFTVTHKPAVTAVVVSPSTASVQRGLKQQFRVAVTSVGGAPSGVDWSVDGTNSQINANGLLTVGAGETASSLTVKATSLFDRGVFDEATVTVTDTPVTSAIVGLTVRPSVASVLKGQTQRFSADVLTQGGADTSVAWSVNGTDSSIDPNGLLTVGAGETSGSLTVTATSSFDNSKSGTATVTVTEDQPAPAILGVVVAPEAVDVLKGTTQQFSASVSAQGGASTGVTWTVDSTAGSTIGVNGLLTVAAGETKSTLKVTATSVADATKSASAIVTVTSTAPSQEVLSVAVVPDSVVMRANDQQQFSATTLVQGGAARTVNWTVSGGNSAQTAISASGLLSIAFDETATALTVTATSTADATKSGRAFVTITDAPPSAIYGFSLDTTTHAFPSATEGYASAPAARTVVIANAGNQQTGVLTLALSGANADSYALSADTIASIADGGTGSFTVAPKAALKAGTHTATVTVSGGNGMVSQSLVLLFIVGAKAPGAEPSMDPSNRPNTSPPLSPAQNVTSIRAPQKVMYMPKGHRIALPKVAIYTKTPAKYKVAWESSNKKIVTISGSTIFALRTGSAVVTAKAPGGKTFKLLVNVVGKRKAVAGVAIKSLPKSKAMKVGKSRFLKAKIKSFNATGSSGAVVRWKSSKPSVLSVDAAGKITAHKKGKARITLTVGGRKHTVTVRAR
ncbi:MAG: Ig-like domain-containing protein [Micrococcales bacterium]|nr:Ig-like domain-containing protein [Micrococcales bacterium]